MLACRGAGSGRRCTTPWPGCRLTAHLYPSHDDDAATPLEQSLAAFAELIQEGKVRLIGASKHSAPRLAEALATSARLGLSRYESLQPLYNLMDRAPYEAALEPLCRVEQIGVINFFGLARGFLTGKYRRAADLAKSPRGDGIKAYLNERGRRVLASARRRCASPQRHTGPGGAGLADQPARADRADLQRHPHGAMGRASRRGATGAGAGHLGGAGRGQRRGDGAAGGVAGGMNAARAAGDPDGLTACTGMWA